MKYASTPLYPGRYRTNAGLLKLTRAMIRDYVENTNAMLRNSVDVPVLGKHENQGPQIDKNAVNSAGWLERAELTADGGMRLIFDVLDPKQIEAIEQKRVKKTSPELSEASYTDGNGRTWGRVIRHVALSVNPINNLQPEIEPQEPAIACSESTAVIRFAEPEPGVRKMKPKEKAADTSEQKEPEGKKAAADEKKLGENKVDATKLEEQALADEQNLRELFSALEINAPNQSPFQDLNGWIKGLCSALQAKVSATVTEANKVNEKQLGTHVHQGLVYQFSEHEDPAVRALAGQFAELQEKVHDEARTRYRDGIIERLGKMQIAKDVKDQITQRVTAIRFSDDDAEEPTVTISEVLDLVENAIPPASRMPTDTQGKHPDGERFFDKGPALPTGHISKERAKEIVDAERLQEFSFAK